MNEAEQTTFSVPSPGELEQLTSKTILAMVRQRMLFSGQKLLPKFITTSLAI